MIDEILTILIIVAVIGLLAGAVAYFEKRRRNNRRDLLDLTAAEDLKVRPKASRLIWTMRGLIVMLAVLVIAAILFHSLDLIYSVGGWLVLMFVANNLGRFARWLGQTKK
jgi:hypothetical protein